MVIANLPYECFRAISKQSSKFNEEQCLRKWENLQSSYGEDKKDIKWKKS